MIEKMRKGGQEQAEDASEEMGEEESDSEEMYA